MRTLALAVALALATATTAADDLITRPSQSHKPTGCRYSVWSSGWWPSSRPQNSVYLHVPKVVVTRSRRCGVFATGRFRIFGRAEF